MLFWFSLCHDKRGKSECLLAAVFVFVCLMFVYIYVCYLYREHIHRYIEGCFCVCLGFVRLLPRMFVYCLYLCVCLSYVCGGECIWCCPWDELLTLTRCHSYELQQLYEALERQKSVCSQAHNLRA